MASASPQPATPHRANNRPDCPSARTTQQGGRDRPRAKAGAAEGPATATDRCDKAPAPRLHPALPRRGPAESTKGGNPVPRRPQLPQVRERNKKRINHLGRSTVRTTEPLPPPAVHRLPPSQPFLQCGPVQLPRVDPISKQRRRPP